MFRANMRVIQPIRNVIISSRDGVSKNHDDAAIPKKRRWFGHRNPGYPKNHLKKRPKLHGRLIKGA